MMSRQIECSACNGKGKKHDTSMLVCALCDGRGWYVYDDQTPTQPDNMQPTPTSGALEAMTDADLKARAEAAWAYLFVYLDEIRRRAGIVVQSEEIPF